MQDRSEKGGTPRGGLSRIERWLMGTAMAVGAACVVLTLIGTQGAQVAGLLGS